MWLQLLAFWHNFMTLTTNVWNEGKQYLRSILGPAPQTYTLLQDGRVLPGVIALPESVRATSYLYVPETHRISAVENADPNARYRRLSYIAASFQHPSVGNVDISDWLGEIRAYPLPELSVKQLLTLWGLTQNMYVPLSGGVQVTITKSDGETDLIAFE
jgi:hypothetical protein